MVGRRIDEIDDEILPVTTGSFVRPGTNSVVTPGKPVPAAHREQEVERTAWFAAREQGNNRIELPFRRRGGQKLGLCFLA